MNAYEWLGTWEPLQAPGKHSRVVPVIGADGYPRVPPVGAGVIRAIPAEGAVGGSWSRSPQARYWLEPERKTILQRFAEWLKK